MDDDGNIIEAKFKTFGCGSAIASSSLATEWIKGKSVSFAFVLSFSGDQMELLNCIHLVLKLLRVHFLHVDIFARYKNLKVKKLWQVCEYFSSK